MKKDNFLMFFWIFMISLWIFIMTFFNDIEQYVITSIINMWNIMIFLSIIYRKKRKKNEPLKDERTEKISCKSIWISWFITFLLLNIFFWIDKFSDAFDSSQLFWILSLIMIFTFVWARLYYNNKNL